MTSHSCASRVLWWETMSTRWGEVRVDLLVHRTRVKMAYFLKGNRGRLVLVRGSYRYHRNRSSTERIFWRCWRKECRAPLQTNVFDVEDPRHNIAILLVSRELRGTSHTCTVFVVITGALTLRYSIAAATLWRRLQCYYCHHLWERPEWGMRFHLEKALYWPLRDLHVYIHLV